MQVRLRDKMRLSARERHRTMRLLEAFIDFADGEAALYGADTVALRRFARMRTVWWQGAAALDQMGAPNEAIITSALFAAMTRDDGVVLARANLDALRAL